MCQYFCLYYDVKEGIKVDYKDKIVLIIGAAKSGIASARYLANKGAKVFLNDLKTRDELPKEAVKLEFEGINFILEVHADIKKIKPQLVIVSPGVPFDNPAVMSALKENIPVWSEMELASRCTKAPMVVITGTNGKTTTTSLVGQIFVDAGKRTFIGGNIGVPFINEAEALTEQDVAVLEASSFQLEGTEQFKPRVSMILNITPDHLDRHGSMQGYINAKAKIYAQQDENDWLVLNKDDEKTKNLAEMAKTRVIFFSRKEILDVGFFVEDGYVCARFNNDTTRIISCDEIKIEGSHNLENALAAVAAGWLMGVEVNSIAESLRNFPGVPHRLEQVGVINGVRYINDSKGTNTDAAIKALEAYNEPIILIAGGKSKGCDFLPFANIIKERTKGLILVGQAAEEIEKAVKSVGYQNYRQVQSFKEAVEMARNLAVAGDIVLLSPACASFDMFRSYEHRGDYFKKIVHEMAKKA